MTTLIEKPVIDFCNNIDPSSADVIEFRFIKPNNRDDVLVGYYNNGKALVRDISVCDGRCHISTSVQPQFLNLSPNRATKDTRGGCAALGGHGQNLVFGRRLKNYNSPARVNMEVI